MKASLRVSHRAEVYAQSLFSLSKDLAEDLASLSFAVESEKSFFLSPLISLKEKESVLHPILERMDCLLKNFVFVLLNEKALDLLPQAMRAYQKLLWDFQGLEEAEAVSSKNLSASALDRLKSALRPVLKKEPLLRWRVVSSSKENGLLVRTSDFVFNDTFSMHARRILESSLS